MPFTSPKISMFIQEQKAIEDLFRELEKVLQFYEEHPHYPLDYDKIRERVTVVSGRLTNLRMLMESSDSQTKKLSSPKRRI